MKQLSYLKLLTVGDYMKNIEIIENNKKYWNKNADEWFGTTALPQYGVEFITENELKLFGDVSGK